MTRLPRRILYFAAAFVLVALAVGPTAGGRPAAAAARQAAPSIELVDQTTWVHAGDQFQVSVRVAGAPPGAALELVVHDRLESRTAFRDTLDGDLGATELALPAQPLATAGSGSAPVTMGFVVGGDGHRLEGRGVYPVEVRLIAADGSVVGTPLVTYLMYLFEPDGPSYEPLDVAVIVDVSGPPVLQPDGTVRPGSTTIQRARERAEMLAAAPDVPLTPAPQPETLEGLLDSGGPGAAAVKALVTATGDRQVLARPYTDIDLEALNESGLQAEADEQTRAGADVVRNIFRHDPLTGVWLSGTTLGDNAADAAVDLGTDRAVVPPSAVEENSRHEAGAVPDAPVTLDDVGLRAMVTDPELAAHLTGDDGPIDAQRFLAELTIMWFERPAIPRAVAVHIPGDAAVDPATVARALNGLSDGQAVQAVPLDQLFDLPPDPGGPTSVSLVSHEVTDDLSSIAGPLRRARRGVNGVAGTVDSADGSSLTRSLLLATGSATPDDQRPAYVQRVTVALGTLSGAVDLPDQFRITLTSRTSTIPVNITNNSNQPLKVLIEFESGQLEFLDGSVITRELPPGATRLDVRVRALTSGAFPMGITVMSPDRTIELDRTTFDIRSTAVTGVGFVLSIGAGLFLAVWWARHWRSSRRSRHAVLAGSTQTSPVVAGRSAADDGVERQGDDAEGYRPAHLADGRTRRS